MPYRLGPTSCMPVSARISTTTAAFGSGAVASRSATSSAPAHVPASPQCNPGSFPRLLASGSDGVGFLAAGIGMALALAGAARSARKNPEAGPPRGITTERLH